MNKKILMTAIGAALVAGPMLAQAAPTVYGHFHMSFDNIDNGKSAFGYVASNSTRIGVKGDEDLGGGLKGIYQVESGALAADTGSGGFGATLRNSYLGFSSSWGAVKVGRYDTPMKDLGRKLDNFNEEVGDARNMLSGSCTLNTTTAGSCSNSVAGTFDQRASNVIRYESPNMDGLTVNALHTSNTDPNIGASAAEGPANGSVSVNSLGVNWAAGPAFVGLAYEKHGVIKNSAGGATTSQTGTKDSESAMRLVGSYTMGDIMVGLIYQDAKDLFGFDAKQKTTGLAASYKMGNNMLKAHYYKAADVKGKDGGTSTGGNMLALGVDHTFSKTTLAYFNYAKVSNDKNTYAYGVSSANGGHGEYLTPDTAGGKDEKGISLGMIMNF
jgi:predicted porin